MSFDLSAFVVTAGIDVVMGLSLYLPMSSGALSVLPIATMEFGAYGFAVAAHHNIALALSVLIGLGVGTAAGSIGGVLLARLHGFGTAMASFAIVSIVGVLFDQLSITGQAEGIFGLPLFVDWQVTLVTVVVGVVGLLALELSHFGLRLRALESDVLASRFIGINVFSTRVKVNIVSSLLASAGGILFAGYLGYLSPSDFGFIQVNTYLLAVLLGGYTTAIGALAGGIASQALVQVTSGLASLHLVGVSACVLVILVIRPKGILTASMTTRVAEFIHVVRRPVPKEITVDAAAEAIWGRPAGPAALVTAERNGDGSGEQVPSTGPRALDVVGVSKQYGGLVVLEDVSLHVDRGEVVAIIGPNGAGKTSLINVVTGLVHADKGEISLDGRRIATTGIEGRVDLGLVRTFQNLRLFPALTVWENVRAAAPSVDRVQPALEMVGLLDKLSARAGSLPYGDRRRLEIARALVLRPKVLLLDEPAAGMNGAEKARLAEVVREVANRGVGVLLIEHDTSFVAQVSSRVVALVLGRVITEGTMLELSEHPVVVEAYLGAPEVSV
jgi:branched-chain amino acid transport system permease protein